MVLVFLVVAALAIVKCKRGAQGGKDEHQRQENGYGFALFDRFACSAADVCAGGASSYWVHVFTMDKSPFKKRKSFPDETKDKRMVVLDRSTSSQRLMRSVCLYHYPTWTCRVA